jgi:ADP-ribose pyrophosphatase YjhB (NUDIX family)
MGYVQKLRRKVGTEPVLLAGAGVMIFDQENRLLLQRGTDYGLWGIPGGLMELGESFEECAIREVFEETGLYCRELVYWRHFSGREIFKIYPNGDQAFIASIVFLCHNYSGTLKIQKEEVFEHCFFPLNEIPSDLDPVFAICMHQYLADHANISTT